MTCQEELREMLKGMCERVKTTLHRGKTLTANFIRFVRVPRALNLEMAVGMFPSKILITNRDVDEGPVGDSCSSRDRVREPVCQLSRKSDRFSVATGDSRRGKHNICAVVLVYLPAKIKYISPRIRKKDTNGNRT